MSCHSGRKSEGEVWNTCWTRTWSGCSFPRRQLHRRVAEIAAEIDRDYAGREPLLVSVLRGSFVFMADLVRQIHLPCTVDFMAVSSYGSGTASSGQVKIVKDLSASPSRAAT